MKPYAEVIGDPVAQSKSPTIHNFWLGKLGIDAEYRRALVPVEQLGAYLAARRADPLWRGCNVTMPHKQAVLPLLDIVDPAAGGVGAANVVVPAAGGLTGFNTDLAGAAEPLLALGDLSGMHALLIGAGGAARAAIAGLRQAGVAGITLFARDPAKASALAAAAEVDLAPLGTLAPPAGRALVVNATSLGMLGNPPVTIDLAAFGSGTVVFDMVYAPLETPLLAEAHRLGLRTVDGLQMLVAQADAAFARFFGASPPRQYEAELRGLLLA